MKRTKSGRASGWWWWVIRHEVPSTLLFTNGGESREVEERGSNVEWRNEWGMNIDSGCEGFCVVGKGEGEFALIGCVERLSL